MSSKNRVPLSDRVSEAAEAALTAQNYVSPVDLLLGLGWLAPSSERRWRLGAIASLEEAMQMSPERLAEAMKLLGDWASRKRLVASETDYVARTPQRPALRFSRSGDPGLEQRYRTHFLSSEIPEKKRERLAAKASRPPDLVVIDPVNRDWTCQRCGGTGDLLIMEDAGPTCLGCAGLGDLEFLSAGNALLTRRAKAKSRRSAVVVRFSRARKRYERKGILVEATALEAAERELDAEGRG
jgi:hypothetical protein